MKSIHFDPIVTVMSPHYIYSRPLVSNDATPLLPPMTFDQIRSMERSVDQTLEAHHDDALAAAEQIIGVDSNPIGKQMLMVYINQHLAVKAIRAQIQNLHLAMGRLQDAIPELQKTLRAIEHIQSPSTRTVLWQINLAEVCHHNG